MVLRFDGWLINQLYREDLIGDLARVLSIHNNNHKASSRKLDEHRSWVDIVIGIDEPRYIPIFNEAWQEFQMAKQAEKESLD